LDGLKWMGLDWDEGPDVPGAYGPYRQTGRMDTYKKFTGLLLDSGQAYEQDGAVFFKVPSGKRITFDDLVYGKIEVMSEKASVNQEGGIKDMVLIKKDGMPTYNYAVVIDDHTMDINTVIRGEDHIINTPKQILIYQALGLEPPTFAHLPMILGKDKKKLSKRHGATSVFDYHDMGYLPDGVFNFLALLGWSPRNCQEIFSREEAVGLFDLSQVTRKPAVLDTDKLNHVNQEQMRRKAPEELLKIIRPFWVGMGLKPENFSDDYLSESLRTMGGRGQTTIEAAEYSDYFLSFDVVKERYDAAEINNEKRPLLKKFYSRLLTETKSWDAGTLETFTRDWITANASTMKEVALPLRWALTGRKVSPGVFEVAAQLGRDECRHRLKHYDLVD